MNQYAIVKKRVGDDVVQVSLLRQTECALKESCGGNCAGCVQPPKGEMLAMANDPIGVKPGERVEVESTAGSSIGLSALVFALPCVFLILGYFVGQSMGLSEGASVGTAFIGLLVGFLPAVLVNRWILKRKTPEFVVARRLYV